MFKAVITIVLLISTCKLGYSGESVGCKDIESKSAALRLRRHLFCDYDNSIRPSLSAHSTVNIGVHFIPKFVEMDEDANTLTFHTWVILSWEDVHLHWDPKDFEGINITHARSEDVWVPEFSVFNSGDLSQDQTGIPSTDCLLMSDGTVECAAARVYTTHCPTDFSNWPYDKHNCTLHFGSWMHFANEINFDFQGILMHEFVQSRTWDVQISNLTKASALYNTDMETMIFLSVQLQRHGLRSSLIFITPAAVLTILTLIVLWLDSRSTERIAVISVNFISHLLCILDLHWYIPSSGSVNTPKILVFYEISLIITAITMILTGFLRKIYAVNVPAPRGVIVLTTSILNSPVGRFIKNSSDNLKSETVLEDGEHNHSEQKQDSTWQDCAIICEWLALIVISATYIILVSVLLPAAPSKPVANYIF